MAVFVARKKGNWSTGVSVESIIPVCFYVSLYVKTDIDCNNNHADHIKNIYCAKIPDVVHLGVYIKVLTLF